MRKAVAHAIEDDGVGRSIVMRLVGLWLVACAFPGRRLEFA